MSDFEALKKQYENMKELCSTAVKIYEDADNLVDDFSNQIMMLTLRVWSAQPGYHEDYNRALKVIEDRTEISEEIFDNLIRSVEEVPFIPIIKQFVHMVVAEAAIEKPFCRLFIEMLVEFLTDMAFINGDCTPEEANEIEQIRMMHMDFYNEFNLTRRRVKIGAVPAGAFKYDRYGIQIEWKLNADGTVDFSSDSFKTSAEDREAANQKDEAESAKEHIAASKLPDSLFRFDMRAAEALGLTDVKVHGWWHGEQLAIIGQLYADKGLKEEFFLTAVILDRDGDVVEQQINSGYGGGGIVTSTVKKQSFFQGYPFGFYFWPPTNKTDDISEIKILFNR